MEEHNNKFRAVRLSDLRDGCKDPKDYFIPF